MLGQKSLKLISFSLLAVLALLMAVATVVEDIKGTAFAQQYFYHSAVFVSLWGALTAFSLFYIFKSGSYRKPFTLLIHLAFVVILSGALTTYLSGEKGLVHLLQGREQRHYTTDEGRELNFPFTLRLEQFTLHYYTGTRTPQDFVSKFIFLLDDGEEIAQQVSMNKVVSFKGYRFFQSGYDEDGKGTHLSVSYDPYGTPLTYFGYDLLLCSLILFFFAKHSEFYRLLRSPLLRTSLLLCWLFTLPSESYAREEGGGFKVLPQEQAEDFANLYLLYNGRICPMQTLAQDFTLKLCGKTAYKAYTAEQVFASWLFYYEAWVREPMIKVKSREVQKLLGVEDDYLPFMAYFDRQRGYKLLPYVQAVYQGRELPDKKGIQQADEKYNIIAMLRMGQLTKLFPCRDQYGGLDWYAPNDDLPADVAQDKRLFINKAIGYLLELARAGKFDEFSSFCHKIRAYQEKEVGLSSLPSSSRFQAEKLYNKIDYSALLFKLCLTIGLFAFGYFMLCLMKGRLPHPWLRLTLNLVLLLLLGYLSFFIALRAYVSGHFPTTNGYETMQFLAWASLLASFCLQFKFRILLPFGFLLSGLSLLVASLGHNSPQITSLMPVLASPLLSVHVATIMLSYLLFAFLMFNGLGGIILHCLAGDYHRQIKQLQLISLILLYPALFLLTVGTFIGAIWANISWGRYWGWDPKEVWALITMLVYSFPIHRKSMKCFDEPLFFHLFVVLAFASVLFTYFGVNYLLSGLHSYANA